MAVPRVDRQTFLSNLESCGLLEPEQLRAALDKLPATPRGRVLARYLVDEGLLTRFQAENLLAGRTTGFVLGQYRILDEVGRGGMGRVFKAEHRSMHRVVALKVLAPHLTRTERARELFQREVRAAGRLFHPHIVTALDADCDSDRFFLALEFIDGPTLAALVREQGPLPVGQACEFVRQAALGLQHAHDLGLVHRDIKPSNLLVQPPVGRDSGQGGVVKITDFGLARLGRAEPASAPANVVMGTPDFLSPEQGRDLDAVDIRSDLYSLGCTFYYLLTGEVPFPGGTPLEKLSRHATAEPEPVGQLRPVVPPGVATVVHRLMAKEPGGRFQTPAALAAALEPFAEIRPVVWLPSPEPALVSGGSVDLMAPPEGSSGSGGGSILSSTQALTSGLASTLGEDEGLKLSHDELRLLRGSGAVPWRWLKWLLFLLAAVIGFTIGAWTIVHSLPGN